MQDEENGNIVSDDESNIGFAIVDSSDDSVIEVDGDSGAQRVASASGHPASKNNVTSKPSAGRGRFRQGMIGKPGFLAYFEFKHPTYSRYFKGLGSDDTIRQVQCKVQSTDEENPEECGFILKLQKGTYSNLTRHLQRKHNIECEKAPEGQPSITNHLSCQKYKGNHTKQVQFDADVRNLISIDGLPPYVVGSLGFLNLMHNLDPKLTVKNRTTYTRQINDEVKNIIVPSLKERLQGIEPRFLNFQTDVWCSRRRQAVLGIKTVYIDKEFDMKSLVIGFKDIKVSHTSANLHSIFKDVLEEYNIDQSQIGAVVTDNATNMKAAFNMYEVFDDEYDESDDESLDDEEDEQPIPEEVDLDDDDSDLENETVEDKNGDRLPQLWPPLFSISSHIGCLSHKLQLAVNSAIKNTETAKSYLSYVADIMKFFKKSEKYSRLLGELTTLDVIIPGKTRWNAILVMLQRFQHREFYHSVHAALFRANDDYARKPADFKKPPPAVPDTSCHIKANELWQILRPVADATDILQADGPTANNVIISIINVLEREQGIQPVHFVELKKELIQQFQNRFEDVIQHKDFVLAAILDPRQKLAIFERYSDLEDDLAVDFPLRPITRDVAESMLLAEYYKEGRHLGLGLPNVTPAVPDDEKPRTIYDSLSRAKKKIQELTDSEIVLYLAEPLLEGADSPLEYWKSKKSQYPILASMARRFLGIPASTGGVERVFSVAGSLGRARRAAIKVKNMGNFIFHRQHFKPIVRKRLLDFHSASVIDREPARKKIRKDTSQPSEPPNRKGKRKSV